MQEKNILKTAVRYIKGVGPRKGEYLTRLGIYTVEDILYYLPTRYEDRSRFTSIKELKVGEHQTVQGEIITLSSRLTKTGMPIFQIAITDQTGFIHALWFNQPYLKDYFRKGQRVIIYGKVEMYDKLQIVQPEYEILKSDEKDSINIGRIVPVYSLTGQLTQRYLRSLAFLAVTDYSKFLIERLPSYLIARSKVVDIKFAIRNIHFPVSFDNLEKAYRRIVFEEFFILQLALAIKKKDVKFEGSAFTFSLADGLIDSFKR